AISPALPPTRSGALARAAITRPGNIAWGSDSAPEASSVHTAQQPIAPPAIPSRITSANARRMMSPVHGSASQCQTSVVMVVMVRGEQNLLARAGDGHDGAAVGRGERLARERLFGRAERNLAAVQA